MSEPKLKRVVDPAGLVSFEPEAEAAVEVKAEVVKPQPAKADTKK